MERDFIFESDYFMTPDEQYCAQMRVVIEVLGDDCSTPTGNQALQSMHVKSIYDEDSRVFRKLEDFPQNEQARILKQAEALSDAWNYDSYLEQSTFYNKAE
jgi:hypothetical protein